MALDIPEFLRQWIDISILGIQGRFEHPTPFEWTMNNSRKRFLAANGPLRRKAKGQQWWSHRQATPCSNAILRLGPWEDHSMPRHVLETIDNYLPQLRATCPTRMAFIRAAAEYGLAVSTRDGTPAPHPDWAQLHPSGAAGYQPELQTRHKPTRKAVAEKN